MKTQTDRHDISELDPSRFLQGADSAMHQSRNSSDSLIHAVQAAANAVIGLGLTLAPWADAAADLGKKLKDAEARIVKVNKSAEERIDAITQSVNAIARAVGAADADDGYSRLLTRVEQLEAKVKADEDKKEKARGKTELTDEDKEAKA